MAPYVELGWGFPILHRAQSPCLISMRLSAILIYPLLAKVLLKRFPFLRTGAILEYWHPMVFYRGMEGFVHSVLSEAGQDYIDRFSKVFEKHVVAEIRRTGLSFFDEAQLQKLVGREQSLPDALISFPDINVFIEAKAGLFDESVMVTGHSEILAHKTRALHKAVTQGWSASGGLRMAQKAPSQVSVHPRIIFWS